MHRDSLAARLFAADRSSRRYLPQHSLPASGLAGAHLEGAFEGLHQVIDQVSSIILGKETQIRLTLACLLARGHLLIEDLPGVGKTTLAHALANSLGLRFQRIQFTSDLLPADIIGVSIFDR
ncbi:MAG TPA: AAA family ATPase, partial [Roseiflexaceae bacterium]